MSRLRSLALAVGTVAAPIVFVAASGTAQADTPSPGDSCTTLHATTKDANGRTMWCNPTMTGSHSLVWQYGGPA